MRYVEKGLGWTYLPAHLAKKQVAKGRVKIIPVSFDHEEWLVPVECILSKEVSTGPALHWLNRAFDELLGTAL